MDTITQSFELNLNKTFLGGRASCLVPGGFQGCYDNRSQKLENSLKITHLASNFGCPCQNWEIKSTVSPVLNDDFFPSIFFWNFPGGRCSTCWRTPSPPLCFRTVFPRSQWFQGSKISGGRLSQLQKHLRGLTCFFGTPNTWQYIPSLKLT